MHATRRPPRNAMAKSKRLTTTRRRGEQQQWHLNYLIDLLICITTNLFKYSTQIMVLRGQDAWRNKKIFRNLWRDPLPGIRPAIAIYVTYLGLEYAYKSITTPKRVSRFKPKELSVDAGHH